MCNIILCGHGACNITVLLRKKQNVGNSQIEKIAACRLFSTFTLSVKIAKNRPHYYFNDIYIANCLNII